MADKQKVSCLLTESYCTEFVLHPFSPPSNIENRDSHIAGGDGHEIPSFLILKETSFLNSKNFDLFVEKKVEDDGISGSSSLVLELPPRKYLAEKELTQDMLPKATSAMIRQPPDSSEASNDPVEVMPSHLPLRNTTDINETNIHLFVGEPPGSDHSSSDGEDYAPELPQRGYLNEKEPIGISRTSPETNISSSSISSTPPENQATDSQDLQHVPDLSAKLDSKKYMPLDFKSSGIRESFYMSLNQDATSDKKNAAGEDDSGNSDSADDGSSSYMHLIRSTMTDHTAKAAHLVKYENVWDLDENQNLEEEQYLSLNPATRGK